MVHLSRIGSNLKTSFSVFSNHFRVKMRALFFHSFSAGHCLRIGRGTDEFSDHRFPSPGVDYFPGAGDSSDLSTLNGSD